MQVKCCERLPICPFFRAVQESDEILDVLNEYVHVYCCGPFQESCYRVKHLSRYGEPPEDNISPSGLDFRKYI